VAPEQQDGLTEQQSAQRGGSADAPDVIDQPNKPGGRIAALLHSRPPQVRHPRQIVDFWYAAAQLGLYRRPAFEHCASGSIRRCTQRPMAQKPLQIQHACAQSQHPASYRTPCHPETPRNVRYALVATDNLGGCLEDDLNAGYLTR
jgi:hypothetical protein